MNKNPLILISIFIIINNLFLHNSFAQITLSNNIGTMVSDTGFPMCFEEEESWGRVFDLEAFGITKNEQFLIDTGQLAISKAPKDVRVSISIYAIDENFPNSFPEYLGNSGSRIQEAYDGPAKIIDIEFNEPIVVPSSVKKILVAIHKSYPFYNANYGDFKLVGTTDDTEPSYYKGCGYGPYYHITDDIENTVPNPNFFINVTGRLQNNYLSGTNTTLTHNKCDDLIETKSHSCSNGGMHWARTFELSDFGISKDEEFIINSGQFALHEMGTSGVEMKFNIYEIDDNFPTSFDESKLIGSSQVLKVPYFTSGIKIFNIDFETPVIIPPNVERVLVEVFQLYANTGAFVAGSKVDDNSYSWLKSSSGGCTPKTYTRTIDLNGRDRFFINVSGEVHHQSNNFQMDISNICSEFLKEFKVTNQTEVASISWNFGDPASGNDNFSSDLSPYHNFSTDGIYEVSAVVTGKDGSVENIRETIDAKEPPKAYGLDNLEACETEIGSGIFQSFDTSKILQKVLGGQTDMVVTFIDGKGNTLPWIPPIYSNVVRDRETITIQVARADDLCCVSETTFDLIVHPKAELSTIEPVFGCDDTNDGFSTFDLNEVYEKFDSDDHEVSFYYSDGSSIDMTQLHKVPNKIQYEESILIEVFNPSANCLNSDTFLLKVTPAPIAYEVPTIIGCDDNEDGISEFFDVSTIDQTVLGNQTGMVLTYYDGDGNEILSPLPNPYTNIQQTTDSITIRVTDPESGCFNETIVKLETSSKPLVHEVGPLYSCDNGNGLGIFDTSDIEQLLIGNQSGLKITYTDYLGSEMNSFPVSFQNKSSWNETIQIRVENENNAACFTETSVQFIVNELPQIDIASSYTLCALEPQLEVSSSADADFFEWTFQDGSIVSTNREVQLINAGSYTLKISKLVNGIICENSFDFELHRSVLPSIDQIVIQELSENNSIEILTSGDGEFEFSIDDINYQEDNYFGDLIGGIYNVSVRDKLGCGAAQKEIVILDYPKFFTPNNDSYNDHWNILASENFPDLEIQIFNRFGKLLKTIKGNDFGWDGTYNGELQAASDYWFVSDLGIGKSFKGHFALIR